MFPLEQGADDPQARLVAQQFQHLDGRTDFLGPGSRSRSPKYLRRHAGSLHRERRAGQGAKRMGTFLVLAGSVELALFTMT
jgi:hypothetical protein